MTTEHILNAIGLLDDDLVREAEEYRRPRARFDYRRWGSLAACCALVIALGWGALWLSTGGDIYKGLEWDGFSGGAAENRPASSAPAAGTPTASAPASSVPDLSGPSEEMDSSLNEAPSPEPDSPSGSAPAESEAPGAPTGEFCPTIMVDGVLYQSTGRQLPGEPDPGIIRTVVSYTSGTPEMDGQTNFSQDLSAQYAVTGMGLVVLVEEEWVLFEPVP